jgi:hypothetical protein
LGINYNLKKPVAENVAGFLLIKAPLSLKIDAKHFW